MSLCIEMENLVEIRCTVCVKADLFPKPADRLQFARKIDGLSVPTHTILGIAVELTLI